MTQAAPAQRTQIYWTDEMDATLIRMVKEGRVHVEIGKALGVTKNAVSGRRRRLVLAGADLPSTVSNKAAPTKKAREARAAIKRAEKKAVAPKPIKPKKPKIKLVEDPDKESYERDEKGKIKPRHRPSLPLSKNPKTVVDIRYGECRAPVGDAVGADQLLCAEPVVLGSYCAEHAVVMYKKESSSSRRKSLERAIGLPKRLAS